MKIKFSFLVVGFLALTGCSKDKVDEAIEGLDNWATKMCACKDKACTDKTQEEYKKWENDVLEPSMKGLKKEDIDSSKMEKGDALDKKRKECRRKFNEE